MKENNTKSESIASAGPLKTPVPDQPYISYWWVVPILLVCFIILKLFIYIKDDKRHGK